MPHEILEMHPRPQDDDPVYLKLNPQRVVPTLLIGGEPFVESAALLMMLAERHPEAGLAPEAGTEERNRWLQWIIYLSVNLGATYRNWFYPSEPAAERSNRHCLDDESAP